jgi:anti-sigma factor RsiW
MKASMKDTEYQNLIETSWRRPLTEAERAKLAKLLETNPQWQESSHEDMALNGLLRGLPRAALSSNFNARVVLAARRAPTKPAWRMRLESFPWLSAGWVPRAALGAAMICCGILSFHEYQAMRRVQEARAMASVGALAGLPSIDWLQNFDTINRMNKVKVADDDLLTVLQ